MRDLNEPDEKKVETPKKGPVNKPDERMRDLNEPDEDKTETPEKPVKTKPDDRMKDLNELDEEEADPVKKLIKTKTDSRAKDLNDVQDFEKLTKEQQDSRIDEEHEVIRELEKKRHDAIFIKGNGRLNGRDVEQWTDADESKYQLLYKQYRKHLELAYPEYYKRIVNSIH